MTMQKDSYVKYFENIDVFDTRVFVYSEDQVTQEKTIFLSLLRTSQKQISKSIYIYIHTIRTNFIKLFLKITILI